MPEVIKYKGFSQSFGGCDFFTCGESFETSERCGDIEVSKHTEKGDGYSLSRIKVSFAPHMTFVADKISCTDEKYFEGTFSGSDGMNVHIYNTNKLVFRKGEAAMKLFFQFATADGKPEKAYLLQDESTFSWRSELKAREHFVFYNAVASEEPQIPDWHMEPAEGGFFKTDIHEPHIELSVKAEPCGVTVLLPDGEQKKFDFN